MVSATPLNSTYILDLSANTWSTGPEMQIARYWHTCNLIERCGRKEIVVVGADTYMTYTKIWDL